MDAGVFFVVHVWCDTRGVHASARDVTCEETIEFTEIGALARFLAASVAATGATAARNESGETPRGERAAAAGR